MTQTLYHVTPASNLPGIRRFGLFTNRGERAAKLNAERAGVFLYTSGKAVQDAIRGEFGEQFKNDPDSLIVLKIELSDKLDITLESQSPSETISRVGIPATCIKNIYLAEPGEPIHIGEFVTGSHWLCGIHSIIDGYPFIRTHGEQLIIKRSTLELVADTPLCKQAGA